MKLTKSRLSDLVKQQCDLKMPSAKAVIMMFMNSKHDDSNFQLTYKGFQLLKFAKFKNYKIKLKGKLNMKAILNLDRQCPCPYYLPQKKQYVFLFAEKPAIVLQMLDGDLENFAL